MNQNTNRITVVAIDDDPDELVLLSAYLRSMSELEVELHAFTEVGPGLERIAASTPDVILLDFQLGETTGRDVFSEIQLAGCDAPAILMTDQGDEGLAVDALQAGFADYLPKQILSSKSLQRSIVNAIEKLALRKRVARHQEELEGAVTKLRARNDEIQSFYHTLSHELKTPLTAAREFLAIVLDGLQGDLSEEQRTSLATAKRCCDQMVVLMNDILDVTRIETGKMAHHPVRASLDDLIERAVAETAAANQKRGVRVDACVADALDAVYVDPDRVLQALTNLIGNAIKYSEEGGRVRVVAKPCEQDARSLQVDIHDEGRGIPADRVERIFERLFQASDEDATIRGGLGLGLNLTRELIRMQGGDIWVQSELGKGSTFSFTIPTAANAPLPKKAIHE